MLTPDISAGGSVSSDSGKYNQDLSQTIGLTLPKSLLGYVAVLINQTEQVHHWDVQFEIWLLKDKLRDRSYWYLLSES